MTKSTEAPLCTDPFAKRQLAWTASERAQLANCIAAECSVKEVQAIEASFYAALNVELAKLQVPAANAKQFRKNAHTTLVSTLRAHCTRWSIQAQLIARRCKCFLTATT